MNDLSVVIPTLNEETRLTACLEALRPLEAETIVVDGGSDDDTAEVARCHGATVMPAERGRGSQMRAGAHRAGGAWLLFLHADTLMTPRACAAALNAIDDPAFMAGTFRMRFDDRHPLLRLYGWFTRFDTFWTSFGDQGLLIRRDVYHAAGEFPAQPLLEDVTLLRALRRLTRIHVLPAEVITSARRFRRHGILRQQTLNLGLLLRYRLGTPAERIAELYGRHQPNGLRSGAVRAADRTDAAITERTP